MRQTWPGAKGAGFENQTSGTQRPAYEIMTLTQLDNEIARAKRQVAKLQKLKQLEKLQNQLAELRTEKMTEDQKMIERIKLEVCAVWGIHRCELDSPSHEERICDPRQAAMSLARELTKMSLEDIGLEFGKHHGTVLHAIRKVKGWCEVDVKFRAKVDVVRERLNKTINL